MLNVQVTRGRPSHHDLQRVADRIFNIQTIHSGGDKETSAVTPEPRLYPDGRTKGLLLKHNVHR